MSGGIMRLQWSSIYPSMIFILWSITKKQHHSVLLSFYMTQNKNGKTHISVDFPVWWSPRDGTRTPKIIVLRDYVVLRIAV